MTKKHRIANIKEFIDRGVDRLVIDKAYNQQGERIEFLLMDRNCYIEFDSKDENPCCIGVYYYPSKEFSKSNTTRFDFVENASLSARSPISNKDDIDILSLIKELLSKYHNLCIEFDEKYGDTDEGITFADCISALDEVIQSRNNSKLQK